MKKILLLLAVLTITGCEPFPDKPVQSSNTEESQSTSTEQSTDSAASDLDYKPQKNIRVSDNEIVIFEGSMHNVQTVKRVEDKDAVCWVTMNSKDWSTSISCLPRAQLHIPEEPAKPEPEVPAETHQ